MDDSDVIQSTTVNTAILEVFLLQQCNVVNLSMLFC